jgi:biopolymer transport protein ExbD
LSFRRRIGGSKDAQFVSFMDMIFNLLLFFLVASYITTNSRVEKRFVFPTPKYELGSAEVFIQWIDESTVFWIDQEASVEVQRTLSEYSYLTPGEQSRTVIGVLQDRSRLDAGRLLQRLQSLVQTADSNPGKKYFVLLRCPNQIPYSVVLDVVARLADARYNNVEYGTVGGTLDQLQLSVLENTDIQGNLRKIIRIDFAGDGA